MKHLTVQDIWTISLIIIVIILAILIATTRPGNALPENITIISPVYDPYADPITSDFSITVRVTDPAVREVHAKIIGQTFLQLTQKDAQNWQGTINISAVQNGNHELTAKYTTSIGTYYYVSQTTPITIQKPAPVPTPTPYGSIKISVIDSNNQPLSGVTINPSGNITASDGIVNITNLTLNQNLNITLTKTSYNGTYFLFTPTTTTLQTQIVTMHRASGDLSEFEVSGHENMFAGRGNYVTVKDRYTHEKIDGAMITIYEGSNVKSIPGTTVNGRLFVSIPDNSPTYEYLIEVTKRGYEDWSEQFTIFALPRTATPTPSPTPTPTPTPQPTPTPVPTINCAQAAAANNLPYLYMTEPECSRWTSLHPNGNLTNETVIVTQLQGESKFPWGTVFIFSIGMVAVLYWRKPEWFKRPTKLISRQPHDPFSPPESRTASAEELMAAMTLADTDIVPTPSNAHDHVQEQVAEATIDCPHCKEWTKKVPANTTHAQSTDIINRHISEKHTILLTCPRCTPDMWSQKVLFNMPRKEREAILRKHLEEIHEELSPVEHRSDNGNGDNPNKPQAANPLNQEAESTQVTEDTGEPEEAPYIAVPIKQEREYRVDAERILSDKEYAAWLAAHPQKQEDQTPPEPVAEPGEPRAVAPSPETKAKSIYLRRKPVRKSSPS